jgi:aspartyl-tRNA synthetase
MRRGQMIRDKGCGEVKEEDTGRLLRLSGWVSRRRDHGGLIFVDIRDRSGILQVVFSPDVSGEAHEVAHSIRSEYVISVSGEIRRRPVGTENYAMDTGLVEMYVSGLSILNESSPLPFMIEDAADASESLRLKHRYLDLRRPDMQKNLIMRHRTVKIIRDYLDEEGFLEIETPMLTKSTPEGARDFLVPSRLNPGLFYALPQSPQLFKQILMAAGIEKYFQIVKCFRDEDLRADRQPEFSQVDVEMSFVGEDEVISCIEAMMVKLFHDILDVELPSSFERLTFAQSMARFGNDKPDLRFGLELKDLGDLAQLGQFKVFLDALASGGEVKGLNGKGMASLSRKEIDDLTREAISYGAKGLAWVRIRNGFESPIAKFFPDEVLRSMADRLGAEEGDLLLFAGDKESVVNDVLSRMRLSLGRRLQMIGDGYRFVWITDFPLLEWNDEEGRFEAMHHPFTSPVPRDIERMMEGETDGKTLGSFRARAYDIVLNGYEIGGGSIRIHQP